MIALTVLFAAVTVGASAVGVLVARANRAADALSSQVERVSVGRRTSSTALRERTAGGGAR
ncbi:hypothetical protein [Nocardiopsis algeriensis]|uniref:Uncharacterized protein n=1 Tax=Nocardiopsis algeriensis TaxID=1478215 RepID=A0A841IY60_9ACTN|nr:hypothetical protein [Nocardiopsis algeriensis]MBB6121168.1 hypothetical protein [Nocardiopsis algeriensis]